MKRNALFFNDAAAIYELLKDLPASDYIDTLGLTTAAIEDFCRTQSLDVSRRTNDRTVEDEKNPPLMVSYFFYYLYAYQQLPNQTQFGEFYRGLNERWMRTRIAPEQREAFDSRLARFYASIMREFHFYHLVKESGIFDAVSYTLRQDIEQKIDVLGQSGGQKFGIQLRVKTRNSKQYADKKTQQGRGFVDSGATLVDFPFDLDQAKVVPTRKDDFLFYHNGYIDALKGLIAQELDKEAG